MSTYIRNTQLVTRKSFRRSIFEAWNHECAYCGEPADTLDHVIPKTKGGGNTVENLVPCCRRCNGFKSDRDWPQWFRSAPWYSIERELRINQWIADQSSSPSASSSP